METCFAWIVKQHLFRGISFINIASIVYEYKLFDFSSILSYAPHSPQEYGTIECIAKNTIGLQQKPCKYHIIQAGKL